MITTKFQKIKRFFKKYRYSFSYILIFIFCLIAYFVNAAISYLNIDDDEKEKGWISLFTVISFCILCFCMYMYLKTSDINFKLLSIILLASLSITVVQVIQDKKNYENATYLNFAPVLVITVFFLISNMIGLNKCDMIFKIKTAAKNCQKK